MPVSNDPDALWRTIVVVAFDWTDGGGLAAILPRQLPRYSLDGLASAPRHRGKAYTATGMALGETELDHRDGAWRDRKL